MLAITNAKIFPVAKPPIERGTIVIRDGIIESVGANVSVPSGAQVIDAAGAEVYPGFIDAQTTIGLEDPGAGNFGDANEILDFNPQLRAQVAFHNDSDAIPVARANGMTTVVVTPGGGLLGGQAAVMNLDGYTWEESTVAPSVGVTFQFPRLGGGGRAAAAVDAAATGRGSHLRRPEEGARRATRSRRAAASTMRARMRRPRDRTGRRDLALESLGPIVDRRQPLITRVATEQEIRDAIAFADRAGVRLVIAAPAPKRRWPPPLLKEKNVPVILLQVLTLPTRRGHAAPGQLRRGRRAREGRRQDRVRGAERDQRAPAALSRRRSGRRGGCRATRR